MTPGASDVSDDQDQCVSLTWRALVDATYYAVLSASVVGYLVHKLQATPIMRPLRDRTASPALIGFSSVFLFLLLVQLGSRSFVKRPSVCLSPTRVLAYLVVTLTFLWLVRCVRVSA